MWSVRILIRVDILAHSAFGSSKSSLGGSPYVLHVFEAMNRFMNEKWILGMYFVFVAFHLCHVTKLFVG